MLYLLYLKNQKFRTGVEMRWYRSFIVSHYNLVI